MTNPTTAGRAPAADQEALAVKSAERRRLLSRALPIGTVLIACGLLAAAAAIDGQAAALVLALWVGVLVVVGIRLSEPKAGEARSSARMRAARRPVLVLAELDECGRTGSSMTLPVVASDAAIAVLDSRPRG